MADEAIAAQAQTAQVSVDPQWEEQMRREERSRRRADIVPHIVALVGIGWSVAEAIAAGEQLSAFVEG